MKLFALTFGDENTPSTHFRLHQYAPLFADHGVELRHAVAKSFEDFEQLEWADVVMLQQILLSTTKVSRVGMQRISEKCERSVSISDGPKKDSHIDFSLMFLNRKKKRNGNL